MRFSSGQNKNIHMLNRNVVLQMNSEEVKPENRYLQSVGWIDNSLKKFGSGLLN